MPLLTSAANCTQAQYENNTYTYTHLLKVFRDKDVDPGVVTNSHDPSTQEAGAEGLTCVWDSLGYIVDSKPVWAEEGWSLS